MTKLFASHILYQNTSVYSQFTGRDLGYTYRLSLFKLLSSYMQKHIQFVTFFVVIIFESLLQGITESSMQARCFHMTTESLIQVYQT